MMDAYEELCHDFRRETPARFNFGRTVDAFATDRKRIALLWEDQAGNRARLTFADIREQSNRVANVLTALGVKRGDPVMIVLPRITLWQCVYIGVLKAGAIAVPCVSMLREKDLVYRANHAGARAIIAGTESIELIGDLRSQCPTLKHFLLVGASRSGWASIQEAMQAASAEYQPADTSGDEPAICYYTSGTTKNPKAVLHGHAYAWAHQFTGSLWLGLKAGDRHWTTADTGWAKAAYGVLFGPWMNGITTFMYNGRFEPRRQFELLRRYGITTFCAPPTEYRMLVKEDLARQSLPALRHCAGAGEPLNPEVIEVWRQHFNLQIHDGYGQTETALVAANLPGMAIKPGSMGRPFPGLDVRVVDENLKEVATGDTGQIAVRVKPDKPSSIMIEYWKQPDENAAVFQGDYYLTGDNAYRDGEGYLWFVGRADDLISSAGYRIGPFEVESALLEHPAVMESAVVASPDADRGAIVKAFVRLKAGVERSAELAVELQEHVKRITAPYKYPREIEFVDDLPKTVSGKIRRVELRDREAERKRSTR
ncbi:MAG TPA: acyl--CoA ligase [Candidatus Binataceae bacterium]|jgi:acyl-coenzyme A synthetase/AMP-(fatty) acid ligase|nr:acyl--CoA ligase [Candidatus Binataceae bacterium]